MIYANYAIEYDSLNLLSLVIKYYCDNDDYENAFKYYKKSTEIEIPYDIVNLPNTFTNESSKYNCGIWFINYIISLKKYEMAKETIIETRNCIKNAKTIPLDYCLSTLSDREKICNDYLSKEKLKSNNYNKELITKYFDDKIIKKMDDNIKTYVNTSIEIYDYLNGLNYELDYSSSLISIMKALESLLYVIIANNYLKYLQNLKEIDFDKIDKSIRIKTANGYQLRDTINRIEYGSVISIIGKRNPNDFNEWIIYNDFYYFFINNMPNINNPQKVLSTFLSKLDDLREKRNNVAHKEPVSKQDAKYCISELIEAHINFISYVYNNFEFCFKDINI